MSNTKTKKKTGLGKIILYALAIFVALHFITDGESTDAVIEMLGIDQPSSTQPYQVSSFMGVIVQDAPENAGALVTEVTEGSPAATAGIQVSDIVITLGDSAIESAADLLSALSAYQEGDSARVIVLQGTTRRVLAITFAASPEIDTPPQSSSPSASDPPASALPSTPPSVPAVDRLPNMPEDLRNHVYLDMRLWGNCEKLTGHVVVTAIFVNDPNAVWTDGEIGAVQSDLQAAASRIMSDAASYGSGLNLSFQYKTATTNEVIVDGDTGKWMDSALTSLGLPDRTGINTALETTYGVDAAPVVFITNQPGRAYATSHASKNEFAILYQDADAFYHELNHIFGAKDFYYPDDVYELLNTHLPNSIMADSSDGVMEDLTAYLIGWTDTPSDKALSFLQATTYLTKEYLSEAHKKENYTGYVTDHTNRNGTYTGYLVKGVRHGQGKWTTAEGAVWEGNWVHGKLEGQGSFRGATGNTYVGGFLQGNFHGQGTYTWAEGGQYTGSYVDGERSGQGTMVYSDGAKYQGQWLDGNRHGEGTIYYTSGASYSGQWINNRSHGQGTYKWSDGSTYTGSFADGKFSGQGTATYANGNSYTGQWEDDKRNGQGTMTYANGSSYTGSWKDGSFNGQGTFVWTSGDKYVGEYVDDKRHGYGIYYYPNGNRYEGQWVNNERTGSGTMYYANGSTQSGTWNNGKLEE